MRNILQHLKASGLTLVVLVVGVISAFSLRAKMGSEGLSGGDDALKQDIAASEERLGTLAQHIEHVRLSLGSQAEALEAMEKLDDVRLQILEIKQRNQELRGELESLEQGLEETQDRFELYKDRYRVAIREAAVGTELEKLESLDGEVYRDVKIRAIDPLGMNITHKEGSCRIPYKMLPEAMQERFQFDAQQADEKLRAERERQRQQWMARQLVDQATPQKPQDETDQLEEAMAELQAAYRAVDRKLTVAKRNLKDQIGQSVSKERQYREEVEHLKELKRKYQDQIAELRAKH